MTQRGLLAQAVRISISSMSADAARKHGLNGLARVRAVAVVGSDPTLMLTGPIAATRRVLERARLGLSDIDSFEVNEAFASVPLMWSRELGVGLQTICGAGGLATATLLERIG